MDKPQITTVARPTGLRRERGKYSDIIAALWATADTGQAIRVELNGMRFNSIQNTLRSTVSRKQLGCSIHIQRDGTAFIAWIEPPAAPHGTGGT